MLSLFASKHVKQGRQFVKDARKLLAYKRDRWPEATVDAFERSIDALEQACATGSRTAIEEEAKELDKLCAKNVPRPEDAAMRENCEVVLVAFVVALAVRTFFLQPFTIPTGSMQPTLNGILGHPTESSPPNPVTQFFQTALLGRTWVDTLAADDETVIKLEEYSRGLIFTYTRVLTDRNTYSVHAPERTLVDGFKVYGGREYKRGEPIARGYIETGDHVFVDKITYHFRNPQRGEVFVFNTQHVPTGDNVQHPAGPSQFYIKRLVGTPGDELRIAPPELFINGKRARGAGFEGVMAAENGYRGYSNTAEFVYPNGEVVYPPMRFLNTPESTLRVPDKCYWAMGDNSFHSSDSRDWGPVPEQNIMGRGLFVYWPFTSHWGLIQ